MKNLNDHLSLVGKLETISITDFRNRPGQVMDLVNLGMTYVVTKAGKAVAVISKVPGQQLTISVDRKGKQTFIL